MASCRGEPTLFRPEDAEQIISKLTDQAADEETRLVAKLGATMEKILLKKETHPDLVEHQTRMIEKRKASLLARLDGMNAAIKRAEFSIEVMDRWRQVGREPIATPTKVYFASQLKKQSYTLGVSSASSAYHGVEFDGGKVWMTCDSGFRNVKQINFKVQIRDQTREFRRVLEGHAPFESGFTVEGVRGDFIFVKGPAFGTVRLDTRMETHTLCSCVDYSKADLIQTTKPQLLDSVTVVMPGSIILILDLPGLSVPPDSLCPLTDGHFRVQTRFDPKDAFEHRQMHIFKVPASV